MSYIFAYVCHIRNENITEVLTVVQNITSKDSPIRKLIDYLLTPLIATSGKIKWLVVNYFNALKYNDLLFIKCGCYL